MTIKSTFYFRNRNSIESISYFTFFVSRKFPIQFLSSWVNITFGQCWYFIWNTIGFLSFFYYHFDRISVSCWTKCNKKQKLNGNKKPSMGVEKLVVYLKQRKVVQMHSNNNLRFIFVNTEIFFHFKLSLRTYIHVLLCPYVISGSSETHFYAS